MSYFILTMIIKSFTLWRWVMKSQSTLDSSGDHGRLQDQDHHCSCDTCNVTTHQPLKMCWIQLTPQSVSSALKWYIKFCCVFEMVSILASVWNSPALCCGKRAHSGSTACWLWKNKGICCFSYYSKLIANYVNNDWQNNEILLAATDNNVIIILCHHRQSSVFTH